MAIQVCVGGSVNAVACDVPYQYHGAGAAAGGGGSRRFLQSQQVSSSLK